MSGPRLIREYPGAEAPPGFWSAPAVIAWIGSRDLRLVAAIELDQAAWAGKQAALDLWEDLRVDLAHYCDRPFGDHHCERFAFAVRQLIARVSDQRLVAYGIRDGYLAYSTVDHWEFAGATATFNDADGFRLLPTVGRLRFSRSDVLAQWPAIERDTVVELAADVDAPSHHLPAAIQQYKRPTGDPGAPEKGATLYMAEFRRRAAASETLPEIKQEAAALRKWYTSTSPHSAPPAEGTIRNRIRLEFWESRRSRTE